MNDSKNLAETQNQTGFDQHAIKQLASFFELLAKIDQRLVKEDPEYRKKYSNKNNEHNRN